MSTKIKNKSRLDVVDTEIQKKHEKKVLFFLLFLLCITFIYEYHSSYFIRALTSINEVPVNDRINRKSCNGYSVAQSVAVDFKQVIHKLFKSGFKSQKRLESIINNFEKEIETCILNRSNKNTGLSQLKTAVERFYWNLSNFVLFYSEKDESTLINEFIRESSSKLALVLPLKFNETDFLLNCNSQQMKSENTSDFKRDIFQEIKISSQ
ncbi:MAG: hypothetical protein HQM10_21385 [Candidatus Riflebacteria bacterium]|nr:hypothetical protein [Candidatus Riflebacteria bacterium]